MDYPIQSDPKILNQTDESGLHLKDRIFIDLSQTDKIAITFMSLRDDNPAYKKSTYPKIERQFKNAPTIGEELAFTLYRTGRLDTSMIDFVNKKHELLTANLETQTAILKEIAPDHQFGQNDQSHIFQHLVSQGKLNEYIVKEIDRQRDIDMRNHPIWEMNAQAGMAEEALRIIYQYRDDLKKSQHALLEASAEKRLEAIQEMENRHFDKSANAEIIAASLDDAHRYLSIVHHTNLTYSMTGNEVSLILKKEQSGKKLDGNTLELDEKDLSKTKDFFFDR